MEFIKKNITLIVGISIPILMIVFVAASIYLPGLFIKPNVNFLYAYGDEYYSQERFTVQNGKLVKREVPRYESQSYYQPPREESKLFLHDVVKNESREVSFEEAQRLNLDSGTKSSDGFEVINGYQGGGFFPFFGGSGSDYNTRYLKGHNVSKKINLQQRGESYYYDFRFLGWIK